MLTRISYKRLALILSLLIGMAGCATTGTQGGIGEYFSDSATTARVKTALIANKAVSGRNIHVKTEIGVVKLSGTASSQEEADTAAAIAHDINSTKSVQNEIAVK